MKDKIKYRRQGQGRRPSHGSRKRHPPHRRDAGSTGRQWLPDPAFPAHKSTNSMTTPSRSRRAACSRVADSVSPSGRRNRKISIAMLTCYKLFGGKGLVTDIKKGEKSK